MHRVDAESALGRCTPFAPDIAVDGIDEFLTGFLPRSRSPLHAETPRILRVAPEYSDRRWTVSISTEAPVTVRDADTDADCVVTGSASDIFLALWNRAPLEVLQVTGDRGVIDAAARSGSDPLGLIHNQSRLRNTR